MANVGLVTKSPRTGRPQLWMQSRDCGPGESLEDGLIQGWIEMIELDQLSKISAEWQAVEFESEEEARAEAESLGREVVWCPGMPTARQGALGGYRVGPLRGPLTGP